MHEMLFYAFLLCVHADSVRGLDAWASKVKLEHTSDAVTLEAAWQPKGWPILRGVSGTSSIAWRPRGRAFYS